jgi:nitrate reductase assembly molybdenum cofactor insertion protein NarJ
MKNYNQYNFLSEMFRYPESDFPEKVRQCQKMLTEHYPEAAETFAPFSKYVDEAVGDELEILFTRTFDVQPISYLDIGYVLFVEDYKRGEFLVNMKREQEEAGNDCGTDLPDNLPNILTLIPKLENKDILDELIRLALVPAIDKMINEFKDARVELKLKVIKKLHKAIIREDLNLGNVYQYVLKALRKVICEDFGLSDAETLEARPTLSNEFINGTKSYTF